MEIDCEVFSMFILSLLLIQERQLSVYGEPASVAQLDALASIVSVLGGFFWFFFHFSPMVQ